MDKGLPTAPVASSSVHASTTTTPTRSKPHGKKKRGAVEQRLRAAVAQGDVLSLSNCIAEGASKDMALWLSVTHNQPQTVAKLAAQMGVDVNQRDKVEMACVLFGRKNPVWEC